MFNVSIVLYLIDVNIYILNYFICFVLCYESVEMEVFWDIEFLLLELVFLLDIFVLVLVDILFVLIDSVVVIEYFMMVYIKDL